MRNRGKRASAGKEKQPQKPRRPFWQRLLAAMPVIVGSILLTLVYGNAPVFRKLETLAGDFTMRVREPKGNSDIVIVRITDDDYQRYFGGKSPLDPSKVSEIITAIALGKPKVIGVDLDTSTETFQSFKVSADWPSIVWAQGATYSNVHEKYLVSGALGRIPSLVSCGLVTLKLDSDGEIRRYTRWYDTDAGPVPSLPWAMLGKFRNDESRPVAPDFKEDFLINYAGPAKAQYFFRIPVSVLYDMSKKGALGEDNIFENKMVILGGEYTVQDEHNTPVGWLTGTEVLAAITETEQQGGGRKPIGTPAVVLLAVFDSVVLLSLIHLFGLWKTLLMSILLVPIMAVLLSLLLFGSVHFAGTFLIILIAVLSFEVYEKGKDYFKKWREQVAEELK